MDENMGRAIVPDRTRRLPRPPKCVGRLYTVRPTDTLAAIAHRFSVTVDQVLAVNPQIKDPNVIFVGQVICIPKVAPRPIPPKPLG